MMRFDFLLKYGVCFMVCLISVKGLTLFVA